LDGDVFAAYEAGHTPVPKAVMLAVAAIERGLEAPGVPERGARERWVAVVSDMTRYARGEPVFGEMVLAGDRDRLAEFVRMAKAGPDPDIALTDPALHATLMAACCRARAAGVARCRIPRPPLPVPCQATERSSLPPP